MTTSSSSPQRGLDAGPIIYSLLSGHPASAICESYIRGHSGWFTTAATLLEVDAVLRKVYGVNPMLAAGKLAQFVLGPIVISAVDAGLATSAMVCATHSRSIWGTRSFCRLCQLHGVATICTDDDKLAGVCGQVGLTAETPIDSAARGKSRRGNPRTCQGKVWHVYCSRFASGLDNRTPIWLKTFGT